MRILFIFHTRDIKGGANISGLTLVRGLKSLGHEVVVLCPARGDLTLILESEGFECKVVPFRMAWPHTGSTVAETVKFLPRTLRDRMVNRRAVETLLPWVQRLSPDIIHSNTSVVGIGNSISRHLRIPHVTHFREFGFHDTGFVSWGWKRKLQDQFQYNIAITKSIMGFHGLPPGRSRLIYNGIYDDCSLPSIPVSRNYLLYAGSLFESKGVMDLLEAYAGLPTVIRSRFHLKIVGTSDDVAFISRMNSAIERYGLYDQVEILGHRHDIDRLMQEAKALIVPSYAEAFGRVVAEAMTNGCIVIGRNTRGIKEQFDNGLAVTGRQIGLRFMSGEELGKLLNDVLSKPDANFDQMRRDALKTVRTLYCKKSYIDSVARFYEEILKDFKLQDGK